jgi:DNA-directed RNA polymerase subunit RPC12/RpoP
MSIFKRITEKPGELLEINRLNKAIGAEEDKIQDTFLAMGKSIFETCGKGEPIPPELVEHCDKIKAAKVKVDELKVQKLRLQDKKLCPKCGAELDINQQFCSVCGAKQEMPSAQVQAAATADTKFKCANCSAELAAGQVFCPSCGAKQ